jgi:hypothetical protein
LGHGLHFGWPERHIFIFGRKGQALNLQITVEFGPDGGYAVFMRRFKLLLLLVCTLGSISGAEAASARIIKVLPHLLDREGRQTLSPSLYERDAYQVFLHKNPDKCSGLRFDIQWKARPTDWSQLKLRVEIRGSKEAKPIVLEQSAPRNHWYSRWSSLTLAGESYQRLGEVVAWRTTLWEGDQLLAEQKSFLW